MKNRGIYLQLSDGRKGIAYNNEQVHKDKFTIKLIDDDFQPVISDKTGKQAIVFRKPEDVKLIGYSD